MAPAKKDTASEASKDDVSMVDAGAPAVNSDEVEPEITEPRIRIVSFASTGKKVSKEPTETLGIASWICGNSGKFSI